MSVLLKGKVSIITGGASGIGKSTVEEFVLEGSHVIIVDVQEKAGQEFATELNAKHFFGDGKPAVIFVLGSITKSEDCKKIVKVAVDTYGRIDILFNNAGIQPGSSYKKLHELEEDVWDAVMDVNVKGIYLLSREVIPVMLKSETPCVIINNSSVQGFLSQTKVPVYAATKGAINSLTRNMALDYAPHIRVLAVAPGATNTPLQKNSMPSSVKDDEVTEIVEKACKSHPFHRAGRPDEIAKVVVFLASDRASFMSGECVVVDGAVSVRGGWAAVEE